MYIDVYEGIMGMEHYIGYIEYKKNLPLPRKNDFIIMAIKGVQNPEPHVYEVTGVLFDYTDESEPICFLVHKLK